MFQCKAKAGTDYILSNVATVKFSLPGKFFVGIRPSGTVESEI